MKIGIVDEKYYALQGELVAEGADVLVYLDGVPYLDPESISTTHHSGPGTVTQVMSLHELGVCDMIFVGLTPLKAGDILKNLFPDIPMMYYSQEAVLLEDDRILAHTMLQRYLGSKVQSFFKLPEIVNFTSKDEAQEYLDGLDHSVVIKQNMSSVHETINRTVIVHNVGQYQIPSINSWFSPEGLGGCTIEQYIGGEGEVSFGMWFDGNDFIGMPYYYIEHKGACNGDRGGVMTGEVGTTMSHFKFSHAASPLRLMFDNIAPIFRGKMCGMLDLNFKLEYKGGKPHLYFMEFTVRFGRPTLETQLATIKHQKISVVQYYFDHMTGTDYANYLQLGDEHLHVVGVTAFTYGLPIIGSIYYANLPGLEKVDWTAFIPSTGQEWHPEQMLPSLLDDDDNLVEDVGSIWLPVFGKFDTVAEMYVAEGEDRHFICCGVSIDPVDAQAKAYKMLENVNLRGITWRDDVGDGLPDMIEAVAPLL